MPPEAPGRRGLATDLLLLAIFAALLYLPGLDTHGVTNWQEGQRLIVAREMQQRWQAGEGLRALIVPTIDGRPYLAKPPMLYWMQMALAGATGSRVMLWHLRLAVALAGIAGVLATYFCARTLFDGPRARSVGRWSAALLATGILSTRSARIGELDALLMPLCTMAIACIAIAWRSHRERSRTAWGAVLAAAGFAILAVLTKDPAAMVIGFGGFGAMALHAACGAPAPNAGPVRILIATVAGGAALIAAAMGVNDGKDAAGAGVIGLAIFTLVYLLAPLARPARLATFVRALSRTHPLIVLGAAVAARIAWAAWVATLVGADQAAGLAKAEAEDNLRAFVPEASINNLEAAAYGVGLGSLAAFAGAAWLIQRRPRLTPAGAHLATWIGLGMIAFSVLGKGVPRYLTPLWPAIAIAGGWAVVTMLERLRTLPGGAAARMRASLVGAILLLGIGQTIWYAWGREASQGHRSPAALARALREATDFEERKRIFTFEFATPALDYELDRRVRVIGDPRVNVAMSGGEPWTVEHFKRFLTRAAESNQSGDSGAALVLIRAGEGPTRGAGPETADPAGRLRAAGITLEPVPLPPWARFTIDGGRREVEVWRARARD